MKPVNKGIYIIKYNGEHHVARAHPTQDGRRWFFDSFDFFAPPEKCEVLARIDTIDLVLHVAVPGEDS